MTDLKNLFERITTVPKVRSINGVFVAIDKTLEDTDYNPYYQRNYVWDDEKATYFIESPYYADNQHIFIEKNTGKVQILKG